MKRAISIWSVLVLLFLGSTALAASTVVVTGWGTTEQLALKDAFRNAIEQEIGTLVSSCSQTNAGRLEFSRILLRSDGYIEGYELLGTEQSAGGCRVRAAVRVSTALEKDIRSEARKKAAVELMLGQPRVFIICNEGNCFSKLVRPRLNRIFSGQGFTRFTESVSDADWTAELKLINIVNGLITDYPDWYSSRVTAKLLLYDRQGGLLWSSAAASAARFDYTQLTALELALETVTDILGPELEKYLSARSRSPENRFNIYAVNIGPLREGEQFLRGLPGVNGVYIDDSDGNNARLQLDYAGTRDELVYLLGKYGEVKSFAAWIEFKKFFGQTFSF